MCNVKNGRSHCGRHRTALRGSSYAAGGFSNAGKMRDTAQQQAARGDVKRQAVAVAQQQRRPTDEGNAFKRQATSDSAAGTANGGRSAARASTGSTSRRKDSAPPAAHAATVAGSITTKSQSKMLLRELCVDKDYLEHLTVDPSNISLYLIYTIFFSYVSTSLHYTLCVRHVGNYSLFDNTRS